MLPTISVIIPCYNVDGYVAAALDSVLDQTYSATEIICIDDGSTDRTLKILRCYEGAYPEIVRVITGANAGAQHARNAGLEIASGDYLQFLDADDVLHPQKFERQVGIAAASPRPPDLICGSYQRILPEGDSREVRSGEYNDDWVNFVRSRCGITSANLWKASAVRAAGAWNLEMKSSQEAELMFRMLRDGGRLYYDREILTTLYARQGSISFAFDEPLRVRHITVRGHALDHLRRNRQLVGERGKLVQETVFTLLRSLYALNPDRAVALQKQLLPRSYAPPISQRNTWPYVLSFKIFGFVGAERLRALMHRVQALLTSLRDDRRNREQRQQRKRTVVKA